MEGLGVFADEHVRAGQIVWSYDTRRDLIVPDETYELSTHEFKAYINMYATKMQGGWLLDGDSTKFINHSSSPNLTTSTGIADMYAAVDIPEGTELTLNYDDLE